MAKQSKTVHLACDYLIIGAGLTGIGFTDSLMRKKKAATFIVVDKFDQPGGHWNISYNFVQLHQPKVWYGVASKKFDDRAKMDIDDLASREEILHYLKGVAQEMIKSKRVQFLNQCEYLDEGNVVSHVTGQKYTISFRTVAYANYMQCKVPANTKPPFNVSSMDFGSINHLAAMQHEYNEYAVIGAGKTGCDAIVHLLDRGVSPGAVTWIIPNDMWYGRREAFKSQSMMGMVKATMQGQKEAKTPDEYMLALEDHMVYRLDKDILPRKWKGGTISFSDLCKLRSISNKIRKGYVVSVTTDKIICTGGEVTLHENTFVIDCSANGHAAKPAKPIFEPGKITIQETHTFNQSMSAHVTALVESSNLDLAQKNSVLHAANPPDTPKDWFASMYYNYRNDQMLKACKISISNRLDIGFHLGKLIKFSMLPSFLPLVARASRTELDFINKIESGAFDGVTVDKRISHLRQLARSISV